MLSTVSLPTGLEIDSESSCLPSLSDARKYTRAIQMELIVIMTRRQLDVVMCCRRFLIYTVGTAKRKERILAVDANMSL